MTTLLEQPTVDAVPSRPVRWPGRVALGFGVLTPLAVAAGIAAVTLDAYAVATGAAWVAIGASTLAVLGGVIALIGNWDRGAAIGGIAIGILGNPLVLLHGLDLVGNL